jgi:uncharacterized protein (TIGR04222 family)
VACLPGGPARVADMAATALLEAARLRVQRDGRLGVTGPETGHGAEAAVRDAVLARPGSQLSSVRAAVGETCGCA